MKFKGQVSSGEEPPLYDFGDGTFSFHCEARDQTIIQTRLVKHNIEFENQGVAVEVDSIGLVRFVSSSSREDITFALEDVVKLLRPYPEGE